MEHYLRPGTLQLGAPPPLSLYVHLPWCLRKCPYCDFNSHAAGDELPEQAYISQLLADLDQDLSLLGTVPDLLSIFMGGGTPSLMSPATINAVLTGIAERFGRLPAEITMEANPGTVDESRFSGFLEAGVTRLSLGIQSFSDPQLTALGRIHTGEAAERAYGAARKAGCRNINLDLMHGLPGQRLEGALTDLRQAISLGPEHLSWYQLTIEPNTAFYSAPPVLPEEDDLWSIYEAGMALLAESGYERYEVSAFSRKDHQCLHNLNYWQFGDYLGIGAGAHGKLTLRDGLIRTSKTRLPKDYLVSPNRKVQTVAKEDLVLEYLMNSLRMTQGFTMEDFVARTGLQATDLDVFIKQGVGRQLLRQQDDRVKPTDQGLQFLNELLMLVD
ncbi:MAG: radical SAM family heme chaperone HemW [Pseudomonadales bacterium]|nr:radical SAM family heme chaperone HemW [Pseudomonadales bacterium]